MKREEWRRKAENLKYKDNWEEREDVEWKLKGCVLD